MKYTNTKHFLLSCQWAWGCLRDDEAAIVSLVERGIHLVTWLVDWLTLTCSDKEVLRLLGTHGPLPWTGMTSLLVVSVLIHQCYQACMVTATPIYRKFSTSSTDESHARPQTTTLILQNTRIMPDTSHQITFTIQSCTALVSITNETTKTSITRNSLINHVEWVGQL